MVTANDAHRAVLAPGGLMLFRRVPAWVGYPAAVALFTVVYYLFPLFGSARGVLQSVGYDLVTFSPVVAIAVGLRRYRPANRTPWLLLAAGELLSAVADIIFDVQHQILHIEADIGLADVFYLASYPVLAVGLLQLVRSRTPGWDLPSIIDASIVAIGAGLLSWVFLISPAAYSADTSVPVRLVSAAYPVMDLLLLSVAARLMLGAGPRSVAFRLLATSLVLLPVADTIYGVQTMLDTYQDGNFIDAIWMLSAATLGASALHPSMSKLTEPAPAAGPDASAGRLAVLATAAMLAPATLLIEYLRGDALQVPVVVGCCTTLFLLVITRMGGLVHAQRHMAITDALTGLRTRRFLEQALITEAERAERHNGSIGLLLLDVDHFKRVNDTYGHHGGDLVLSEIARRLRELIRPGTVVARYGGEEFAVLVPGVAGTELAGIGERIRRGIANTPIAVHGQTLITVTVSIGAAALPEHVDNTADLTLTADRALYAAKESGRNRVVSAVPVTAG